MNISSMGQSILLQMEPLFSLLRLKCPFRCFVLSLSMTRKNCNREQLVVFLKRFCISIRTCFFLVVAVVCLLCSFDPGEDEHSIHDLSIS